MPAAYSHKRPRHYAAEIIALPTQAARREALAWVPDIYQDWVRELVSDYFAKRRCLQRYQASQQSRYRRF